MRSYNIIICTRTADDDSATAIIQAPFLPWFPRPTRKAPPPPSRRGFVLFLVLLVARDLHHLFEKQHPDSRVALLHPKPVHHIHGPKYFSDVSCTDINCGRCDENHRYRWRTHVAFIIKVTRDSLGHKYYYHSSLISRLRTRYRFEYCTEIFFFSYTIYY